MEKRSRIMHPVAPIELTQHTFLHLFWFFGIFSITGMLFLLTSYTEKTKRIFAILVPILIISDLAAQWLYFAGWTMLWHHVGVWTMLCHHVAVWTMLWHHVAVWTMLWHHVGVWTML